MHAPPEVAEPRDIDFAALAEHFDRTDAGDLPWEEATDVAIARSELEQISLRLPREDLAELKRRAANVGVGYTTLIRMILRQHLRNPLVR
jgi:predicted DNA binding CopG/RHH family protein